MCKEIHTNIRSENVEARDYFEGMCIDGRLILE
jgi:hypothetical protein